MSKNKSTRKRLTAFILSAIMAIAVFAPMTAVAAYEADDVWYSDHALEYEIQEEVLQEMQENELQELNNRVPGLELPTNLLSERGGDLTGAISAEAIELNPVSRPVQHGAFMDIDAQSQNGILMNITGFLTFQGQMRLYGIIDLFPGEVLHIQADMPNSAAIDYDLYLFRTDWFGNLLEVVDASFYTTYINGASGTLPEAVGFRNNTNSVLFFAVGVESFRGSSTTMPYHLHIAINNALDPNEADENIRSPRVTTIALPASGNHVINNRTISSLADNDWFRLQVPASVNFERLSITLDALSVSAGYRVELYTRLSGDAMRKIVPVNGEFVVPSGTSYIRVTSTGSSTVTGANYVLTLAGVGQSVVHLPGTPQNPVPLTRYRETTWRENIQVGQTLPSAQGFYYRFNTGSFASTNTITLLSQHSGLRFRIYNEAAYLANPGSGLVFDSNAANSGANRGRESTVALGINLLVRDVYVQKINANRLATTPGWVSNTNYLIVVYDVAGSTPIGNNREFFLAVGDALMSGTTGTGNLMSTATLNFLGGTRWSINHSINPATNTFFFPRNVTNTGRVTHVVIGGGTIPYTQWSVNIQNFSQSGSLISRSGTTLPNTQTIFYPGNGIPLSGNWNITWNITTAAGQGNARPGVWFFYVHEIGD